jgi:hypothetical protein
LRALLPPPVPNLGRSRSIDVAATRTALQRAATSGNQVFWILVAMICVLFVLELVLFVVWADQPGRAATVATASGVSLPFLLYFLRDSWRTKVQADTLLALAGSLDPAILQSVVKAFVEGVSATAQAHDRSGGSLFAAARRRHERRGVSLRGS